jgi:hypothetical protein
MNPIRLFQSASTIAGVAVASACTTVAADSERVDRVVWEGPHVVEAPTPVASSPPVHAVPRLAFGFDAEHRPVAFELRSGAVASRASAPVGEPPSFRDLVFDAAGSRLLLFESDGSEPTGTASVVPFAAPKPLLGAREPRAWLDGLACLWPLSGGIVAFERSYGTRWRFLPDDGSWIPSQAAPLPVSLWGSSATGGSWLDGIADPGAPMAELQRVSASSNDAALGVVEVETTGLRPGGDPSSARAVAAAVAGDAILVDVTPAGGDLSLRRRDGGLWQPVRVVEAPFEVHQLREARNMSLAAAAPEAERIAVLIEQPPALGLIEWRVSEPGAPLAANWVQLEELAPHDRWTLSRQLLVAAHNQLLLATGSGVSSFLVLDDGGPAAVPSWLLDPAFVGDSLRGPLAGPAAL